MCKIHLDTVCGNHIIFFDERPPVRPQNINSEGKHMWQSSLVDEKPPIRPQVINDTLYVV